MNKGESKWSRFDQKIINLFSNGQMSYSKAAKKILSESGEKFSRYDVDLLRTYIARMLKKKNSPIVSPDVSKDSLTKTMTKDGLSFDYKGERSITSLEEAIEFFEVDTRKYIVERFVVNSWDVTGGKLGKRTNYQVKATFKLRGQDSLNYEELSKDIINDMNSHSPSFVPVTYEESPDPHCLIVDLADLHIGKYAAITETGEGYDVKEAVSRAERGLIGLIQKAKGFSLDKIIFVIGNDVLHTDGAKRTTTAGTPQDTDGMWHENFLSARKLYVWAIEQLRLIAPVDVVYCPSNHDYVSGFMLSDSIKSWFRNAEEVSFNTSIQHRKYLQYGKSLIGFSHGDGAKLNDYPMLMATEAAIMWADTKFRYVYLHHVHHKDAYKFQVSKDFIGCTVEFLRSPSGTDGWHDRNGYTGVPKAVEAFIHSKDYGQVARITHTF